MRKPWPPPPRNCGISLPARMPAGRPGLTRRRPGPGREAFHRYSDLFIPAFFVVTLQNAATLISKAFYTTGRVTTDHGGRRIRQNTRHFVEIMLPGALEREGEGWKLSVRIRLVHAQVRRLIRSAGNWEERIYGTPLSAAHMALSAANFSATMLYQADRLGAHLNAAERARLYADLALRLLADWRPGGFALCRG